MTLPFDTLLPFGISMDATSSATTYIITTSAKLLRSPAPLFLMSGCCIVELFCFPEKVANWKCSLNTKMHFLQKHNMDDAKQRQTTQISWNFFLRLLTTHFVHFYWSIRQGRKIEMRHILSANFIKRCSVEAAHIHTIWKIYDMLHKGAPTARTIHIKKTPRKWSSREKKENAREKCMNA